MIWAALFLIGCLLLLRQFILIAFELIVLFFQLVWLAICVVGVVFFGAIVLWQKRSQKRKPEDDHTVTIELQE